MPAPPSLVGRTIGLYRVVEALARGGTATVYRCVQERGGAELAIKLVEREAPDFATHRARILNEAALTLRARHPGIVRAYATGEIPEGCYVVQELLRGQPLHHLLREQSRPGVGLPAARAARMGARIAEALAHLHALGLVHTDLKPPNVMCCAERLVICDLGYSVTEGDARPDGLVIGSPSYLAPEVAPGAPLTRAVDLWALGVILFELLTGVRPFGLQGAAPEAILRAARTAPLPAMLEGQPEALRELIEALLVRDPALRLTDAGEVSSVLGELAG